jgi:CRP/FNR family transcriptional regulator, anaerobic regulatory protein
MTDNIMKQVKAIVGLKEAEELAFLSVLERREYTKGDLVLREGSVCNFILFIELGCVRYFYNRDGEEVTGQFFEENDWFTDYESYLTGKPSEICIQALEDCVVFVLPKKKIVQLFVDFPVFEKFGRLMAERAFLGLRNRNKISTLLSSEDLYLSFVKNRSSLVQRVAQHYIASYLGLKPQSLSRIRKRLSGK